MTVTEPQTLESFQEVESENRRRYYRVEPLPGSRIDVRWRPAGTELADESPWLEGSIHDISGRGLGIWASEEHGNLLSQDMLLELEIDLPGRERVLSLYGNIRELGRSSDLTKENFLAVEFILPESGLDLRTESITRYVAECQRERIAWERS